MQSFNKFIVISSYYLNTNLYAKNCINKAKPKLHCNGKCQMMKKISEEEEKKNSENTIRKSYQDEVLSSKSFFSNICIYSFNTKFFKTLINSGSPTDQSSYFFHPPNA